MSSGPPGPRGDAVIGNLLEFESDPLQFLSSCASQYGDVVQIAANNVLVVHPREIEQVLVDREHAFVKLNPTRSRARSRTRAGFATAMMNSEGADWKKKRQRLSPAFHRTRLDARDEAVVRRTAQMVQGWPMGGFVNDVHRDLADMAFHIASGVIFGVDSGVGSQTVVAAADAIMQLTSSRIRLPEWLPTRTNRRLFSALGGLRGTIDELLALRGPTAGQQQDAASLLVNERPALPTEYVRDELATLLLSGHETTADALTWALYLLALHPQIDRELEVELTRRLGGRPPRSRDLASLPILSSTVKEALRLYPPAWLTSRECVRDVELGGHRIPAGTTVAVSQWVTHRDRRFFSAPHEFSPLRWRSRSVRQPPKYAYLPFGAGPRACLGANLALLEIPLALATIRQRVKLVLAPGARVRPRPALSLQPLGFRAIVEEPSGAG